MKLDTGKVSENKRERAALAEMVGVSCDTISSIEIGPFNPIAEFALILCIALDKKIENSFTDSCHIVGSIQSIKNIDLHIGMLSSVCVFLLCAINLMALYSLNFIMTILINNYKSINKIGVVSMLSCIMVYVFMCVVELCEIFGDSKIIQES